MNAINYPFEFISYCIAILCFAIIIYTGITTDLLKEPKSDEQPDPPYSFSRFQFWLWTLVVCPIYALHWGHIERDPYLNPTSLKLLGIAFGTTLIANVISSTQKDAYAKKNHKAKSSIPPFKSAIESANFWSDILKDDLGQFSVARLQNLIFTFIYVGIYVSYFFSCGFEYPDWDENPFILMGITSGTYLVAKGMNK